MRWLRSFSSQTRLVMVFSLLILAAAWFAGSAVINAVRYQEQLSDLQTLTLRQQRRSNALSDFITEELLVKNVLLDPAAIHTHLGGAARFRETFKDFLQYEQITAQEDEAEAIQEMSRLRDVYDETAGKLLQAVQDGAPQDKIDAIHIEEVEPAGIELEGQIFLLAEADRKLIQERNVALQESVKATAQSGGVAFILLGILLVLGVSISDNIFEPASLRRLAARRDEIGAIAGELIKTARRLSEYQQTLKQQAAEIRRKIR